ncbi:hypothetical protein DL96DRAFT_1501331 [Flagelloscypha sp. PMI_526]|nr:hypothetical protein DL96DRAFT_1501331 [Flagelloscypha sp. PMI_526]
MMIPERDMDTFGLKVLKGDMAAVKADIEARSVFICLVLQAASPICTESLPRDAQLEKVAQELHSLRYGPTSSPLFNCIGQGMTLIPHLKSSHLDIARYLLSTFGPVLSKIPIVDAPDLAGTSALTYSISTKPMFELEYAQILWDAGANINARNRYGATAAHEFGLVWQFKEKAAIDQALHALEWFLSHGGNIDLPDGDGAVVRATLKRLQVHAKTDRFEATLRKHDAERVRREKDVKEGKAQECLACGETQRKLFQCSRCRLTKYCAPPRSCQKADWTRHKSTCKAPGSVEKPKEAGFTYLGQKVL